jgi:hypothetical protein
MESSNLFCSSSKEKKQGQRYKENATEGSNLLVKKFSVFESKPTKEAIDLIQNVADCIFQFPFDKNAKPDQSPKIALEVIEKLAVSENHFCTTCQIQLSDRNEQLEHYKCDVHLFNMKQKLKGKPIVTAEEFEILSGILFSLI